MAPRIGFTLRALQQIDPAACSTDARLVWKSGDIYNLGIVRHDGVLLNVGSLHPRELRLLAKQMNAVADYAERTDEISPFEVVLP